MPLSLRAAYQQKVSTGEIIADPAQAAGLNALSRLEGELNALAEPGFALPFLHRKPAAPRGVYLWGPVGRGKSLLMDLFVESAPVARKRRVHFHAFMGEAHALVALWRSGAPAARRARFGQVRGDDPIPPVAEALARDARLLCFDEFQVTDIADAMILGRLFEALFTRGVVVVATSNRAPASLYADGINRQLFLPFITLITDRMEVVEVAGAHDFRQGRARGDDPWLAPSTAPALAQFEARWVAALGGAPETGAQVEGAAGRPLCFPRAAGERLRVGFDALCDRPLGAQDYLAVAARFPTIFLEGVPVLAPERRNAAARLVALVDALYEAGTRLTVLAEAAPEAIYPAGDGAFQFARTASRLEEMRAADWRGAA